MRRLHVTASLVFFLCFCCLLAARAQGPATEQLVRQILSITGRKPTLHLQFTNHSSAGVAQAAAVRRELQRWLHAAGARFVPAGSKRPAVEVDVTLSETWRNLLLVAEIQRGKTRRVIIEPLPRSVAELGRQGGEVVSLTRRIVWRQRTPIVSFLLWQPSRERSSYLWVLEPDRLVLYRLVGNQWRMHGSANIHHAEALPRDVRGLLWIEPGASASALLHAALPGVDCSMPLVPARGRLPLACRPAKDGSSRFPIFHGGEPAWQATLVPARNYFAAAIESGVRQIRLRPFYSATVVDEDHSTQVILAAATDGKTYVYDAAGKTEGSINGWGSDIAGIETACGNRWQVLATRPGDWTAVDSLAAYEIVDGKAVSTGEPIDLPGPVTGLWPALGGSTADAVVLDLNTGLYEAYTISLSCGR